MNKSISFIIVSVLFFTACNPARPQQPMLAVLSAFDAELELIKKATKIQQTVDLNGTRFYVGTLSEKDVVLALSGVSMINAAMNTQALLDHFDVTAIVFSGIAGGVSPDLNIGDVVAPEKWVQFQENTLMRQQLDGSFVPPSWTGEIDFPAYGMMLPAAVQLPGEAQPRYWFNVDPQLVAVARQLNLSLEDCTPQNTCLSAPPKLVVGGEGGSSQSFVDNAEFRAYLYEYFSLEALDMESAAVAHVATVNKTPFIIFRSLSDLAGGGEGENEIGTFFQLAAENSAKVLLAYLDLLK